MSNVFCYYDHEYQFIETELDEEAAEIIEDQVNSGRCADCNRPILDWGDDANKFTDLTLEFPMPVNVCYKCAARAFKEGRM